MGELDLGSILPRAHLPVGRIDAGGVDVDDDFPGGENRIRQVPVLEDVRAAEGAEEAGFHDLSSIALAVPLAQRSI
jgi:hypothetical protein